MLPIYGIICGKKKSKAIALTGHGGLYGIEMLRITHCLHNRLTDGGNVVSLTHRQRIIPDKHYFSAPDMQTNFCYRLSEPWCLVRLEGLGKLKRKKKKSFTSSSL
jgi:hypothetical protein